MSWADDVVTVLEDGGVATYGEDLFVGTAASIPRVESGLPTIQVLETFGTAPEYTHNTIRPAYRQPTAQLTIRADDYQAASDKASEAYEALNLRNSFINSGWYKWIKPLGDIGDLGLDSNEQVRLTFNIIGNKRP